MSRLYILSSLVYIYIYNTTRIKPAFAENCYASISIFLFSFRVIKPRVIYLQNLSLLHTQLRDILLLFCLFIRLESVYNFIQIENLISLLLELRKLEHDSKTGVTNE